MNPKPPRPGDEYTFTTDTGPQKIPSGVPVVNLIPVGDGLAVLPLPRTIRPTNRKPLVPSKAEVAGLPRWAGIAFAARCARRLLPRLAEAPPLVREAGAALVVAAEQSAAGARLDKRSIVAAMRVVSAAGAELSRPASVAATAIVAAGRAEGCEAARAVVDALREKPVLASPRLPRRDFDRVSRLARTNGWTDETPVPPAVFGPLWPLARVPDWAQADGGPRE